MRIDYRELKRRIRLKDLLEELGWQSTGGCGDQLRGPCPLPACQTNKSSTSHGSEKRSFSVHIGKNVYSCFRCHTSGNVLDFWGFYRGITWEEAAKELAPRLEPGIRQPKPTFRPTNKS